MTQVFPYSEPDEEPESEGTPTGSTPDTQPPAEPPASEAADQTLISGTAPEDSPAENPDQTLLSSSPAETPEEPTGWMPAGESPVESSPESWEPEASFAAAQADTLPEGGFTVQGAAGSSESAPQPAPNGSVQSIASTPARPSAPPLSAQDERTWSMIAQLTMLLNLVTGFLGPVAALIIYLVYKDRSRLVAFHAMQSFVFQLVTWIGAGLAIGAIWVVTGLLSAVLIGLLCIPFTVLLTIALAALPLVGLVYAVIGAIQVNSGQPFSYWLVGDWVRGMID